MYASVRSCQNRDIAWTNTAGEAPNSGFLISKSRSSGRCDVAQAMGWAEPLINREGRLPDDGIHHRGSMDRFTLESELTRSICSTLIAEFTYVTLQAGVDLKSRQSETAPGWRNTPCEHLNHLTTWLARPIGSRNSPHTWVFARQRIRIPSVDNGLMDSRLRGRVSTLLASSIGRSLMCAPRP